MNNPYADLGRTPEQVHGEDVEGCTLFCQENGCYNVSKTAKYLRKDRILTWVCLSGHISKIEGYDL